ncbi:hypothetical protein TTHERM_002653396, partial (macronuclear) [Tetrahymena thermophila SB210]
IRIKNIRGRTIETQINLKYQIGIQVCIELRLQSSEYKKTSTGYEATSGKV